MTNPHFAKQIPFLFKGAKLFTSVVMLILLASCGGDENSNNDTVKPQTNIAPIANAGDDKDVIANEKITLSGTGSDADGSITQYQWQQLTGTPVTLSDDGTQSAYFIAPNTFETIQLVFQLTVTDNQSASHIDIITITVKPDPNGNWEPSLISNCDVNKNLSPVAGNVLKILTEVGNQLLEPSIIFSDQTFTFYSREESTLPFISKTYLQEGGNFEAVDGEDKSLIFDDGTHGDLVAGDGIYTRGCLYVPEELLQDRLYFGQSHLFIINKNFRNSESVEKLSDSVSVNDTGLFINLGAEYHHRLNDTWNLISPETCQACQLAWQLAGDVFDFFSVTPREPLSGAGYVRVHDNIQGAGFKPECEHNSYCYKIVDGQEHQKLTGIIWSGWPTIGGLNHELGHGLIGVASSNFPAEGNGAWNSGDGMHHDADITVNGELSGPFWDPDRGWPHSVVLENEDGERFETYLVRDLDGQFRIKPLDDTFSVWDDILLYIMGLLDEADVSKTYYKLVNPRLSGCRTEAIHLVCKNDLVDAEQIISFTVSDFIAKFGQWSAPSFYHPEKLTMGVLNISDRPHTNAEIVFTTKMHREFASTSNLPGSWFQETSWYQATRGLSQIDINVKALIEKK